MAEPYLKRLAETVDALTPSSSRGVHLECRHFFSGAALYANGTICATLTPRGLAVKLPAAHREELLQTRQGRRLRYFRDGPIKKEYVVLGRALKADVQRMHAVFDDCIRYVGATRDDS